MYRLIDLKNKFMVTGGEGRRGERLGVWNWHIHTVLFRLYLHFVLEILRAVGIYQIDGNVLPWNSWKASWGKWVLICVLKTGWKVRLEEAHVNRSRNVCVSGSMSPKSDERPHRGLTDWGSLRSLSKQESVKPLSVGRVLALLLFSHHIMSSSLRPHGLWPVGLLCPWDFPSKNTGVGCHFLLQGIFLTQGLNPGLPHCRQMLYHLSHQGSPCINKLKDKNHMIISIDA